MPIKINMPERQAQALRYMIPGLFLICLLLGLVGASGVTLVIALGSIGIFSYFLPDRSRLSWYAVFCAAYLAYLFLTDLLIFPYSGTYVNRSLASSFFCGVALHYAAKRTEAYHTSFMAILALFAFAWFATCRFMLPETFAGWFAMQDRFSLFGWHPNFLAFIFSTVFISCLAALCYRRERYADMPGLASFHTAARFFDILLHKWVLTAALAVAGVFIIMTLSRTGLIACFCAAMLILLCFFIPKKGLLKTACISALLAVFFVGAFHAAPLDKEVKNTLIDRLGLALVDPFGESTFISRMPMWKSALNSGCEAFWLGNGTKSFVLKTHPAYVKEHYDELVAAYGKNVIDSDTASAGHAHNQYLHVFTEQGIIGLVFFCGMLFYPLWAGLRQRSLFGVIVPVLTLFAVSSITEAYLTFRPTTVLTANIVLSCCGYFSCIARPIAK